MKKFFLLILLYTLTANHAVAKDLKKKQASQSLSQDQVEFFSEQKLLQKKLDMCLISIQSGNKSGYSVCKDAQEFERYLTKGKVDPEFETLI